MISKSLSGPTEYAIFPDSVATMVCDKQTLNKKYDVKIHSKVDFLKWDTCCGDGDSPFDISPVTALLLGSERLIIMESRAFLPPAATVIEPSDHSRQALFIDSSSAFNSLAQKEE